MKKLLLLLSLLVTVPCSAQKVSQFPPAGAITDADTLSLVQSGTTTKATAAQIKTYIAATTYTLPVATVLTLGGVKQGANVTIAGDGTISIAGPVTSLPWGSFTGPLSNQADLQTVLNAKLSVTTAAASYQPLNTTLTSLGALTLSGSANSSTFLRGDGSWATTPSGYITSLGGNMTGFSVVSGALNLSAPLGSAAFANTSAFDAANAAATAQTAAQAFAIQRSNHTGTQLLSTISDVTTVGGNIAKASNPSAVTFLRINADNTISFRTASQLASDLGLVASATTDTTNASNITSGTLAAARVATLNQNTTGSAGSFTGSLAGDVTGTQSATVVGKINGTAVSSATSTALGATLDSIGGIQTANSHILFASKIGATLSADIDRGGCTATGTLNGTTTVSSIAYTGSQTFTATTTLNSNMLTVVSSLTGISAGMYVTGTGLPAGTKILNYDAGTNVMRISTIATASGTTVSITAAWVTGIVKNQVVTGTGIQSGTTVVSIVGTTLTLSKAATGSGSQTLTFTAQDDTTVLQAALDSAATYGNVTLVIDGGYASYTNLAINYSNTTIVSLMGSGAFMASGSNQTGLQVNVGTYNAASARASNISIIGGIWNFNGNNQLKLSSTPPGNTYNWNYGLYCSKIDKLIVRDVTVRNSRTYAYLVQDCTNFLYDNDTYIVDDYVNYSPGAGGNHDGYHVLGGTNGLFRGCSGAGDDDWAALNTDEGVHDYNTTAGADLRFMPTGGASTNIAFQNCFVNNSRNGIRLLGYTTTNGVASISGLSLDHIKGTSTVSGTWGSVTVTNFSINDYDLIIGNTSSSVQPNVTGLFPSANNGFLNIFDSGTAALGLPALIRGSGGTGSALEINNTSTGGHDYYLISYGSSNHPGQFGIVDNTIHRDPLTAKAVVGGDLVQTTATGVFSYSSNSSDSSAAAPNAGMSCISAGLMADGNGSQGDFSGSRKMSTILLSSPQTTVNGSTAGNVIFTEPETGSSSKLVRFYCSATFNGTASYTFPTAFTNTPSANQINLPTGVTASAISTTAITLTGTAAGAGGGSVGGF